MDVLKQMLEERTDVEYTEVRFRSDEGFGSVRAFVSFKSHNTYHLVLSIPFPTCS